MPQQLKGAEVDVLAEIDVLMHVLVVALPLLVPLVRRCSRDVVAGETAQEGAGAHHCWHQTVPIVSNSSQT